MSLEVAADLMHPRLLQRIVDVGIANRDLTLVQNTGLLMLLLTVFGIFAGGACTVFATLAAQNFGADVRGALFAKVQSLSFGNLDELESGALITRLTNDVNQVQEVVLLLLRVMVRVPLLLVGSLILAIVTSPRLALVFIPLIPFVIIGPSRNHLCDISPLCSRATAARLPQHRRSRKPFRPARRQSLRPRRPRGRPFR